MLIAISCLTVSKSTPPSPTEDVTVLDLLEPASPFKPRCNSTADETPYVAVALVIAIVVMTAVVCFRNLIYYTCADLFSKCINCFC